MKDHMEDYKAKNYTWGGSVTGRLDNLELARERTDMKCDSVRDVLTSWMVTFEALEMSIGRAAKDVKTIEDWLVPNSQAVIEVQGQIVELLDLSGFRHTNTCVTRVILSGQWMTSTEYFTRNRIYYRVRA